MTDNKNHTRAEKFCIDINKAKDDYKRRNYVYTYHGEFISNEAPHTITFKDGSRASRTRSYGHDWEPIGGAWKNTDKPIR